MQKFNPSWVASTFFLLFLIIIFFPIRYVFPTTSSLTTGLYSDFTSISLYLSDIFLFIAFIFILWSNNWNIKLWLKNKLILLLIIWLILGTFIFKNSISGLNIWYFAKFVELTIVSYGTTILIFKSQPPRVKTLLLLAVFVCLGTLQSVIGLLQFINQSPIGLNLIGEQVIYPNLWGVAKIVSGGTAYIRAYGTFPHPNVFSAFLVITILINIYLLISTTWKRITLTWLNLALFINTLGLTATFSRGAFLALGLGLVVYFGVLMIKHSARIYLSILLKILLALVLAFMIFKPWLLSRATISDQASVERKIYNQTALNIINDKPIFGLGVGESVLEMKRYSPVALNPWQIQPIHNFFLLSAAEIGIPGMLILLWIFFSHLKKLVSSIKYRISGDLNTKYLIQNTENKEYLYKLTLLTILFSFMVLMLFDHYFYTLQQTQMLLWIVLGLIAAEEPQTKFPS